MPKRTDIKSVMVIGSGPIVIGQAAEFDYSGTQACRVLREEGIRVILVNSNPATIMTDPEMADATYIEPISTPILEQIIAKERPDALLPTLGGQTALNAAMALGEAGVLKKYNVELIGASLEAIDRGEDRELFKKVVEEAGAESARSDIAHSIEEVDKIAEKFGYPLVVRPSFTMGGLGSGIAHDEEELHRIAGAGIHYSPTDEVLIEEGIEGWKEYELELMRDKKDNVVVVCPIENVDPVGVHTGDSITVAPVFTLTDREYQKLRDIGIAIIRGVGVDTGGCNIQFAINPNTGRIIVIEMNPRVSRSSALASKATGFPIAKIATKLALGYTLDEIQNDITQSTPASFEPTIDYVVTKVPRFAFEKFPGADPTLTTSMKSVGEAMALAGNFQESLGKAMRSIDKRHMGFNWDGDKPDVQEVEQLLEAIKVPTEHRYLQIQRALWGGATEQQIFDATKIDPWFIRQFVLINETALEIKEASKLSRKLLKKAKLAGLSDLQIAHLRHLGDEGENTIRELRWSYDLRPVFKTVDTCAAEFDAVTPYYYSCYADESELRPREREAVIILGSGPNRIGQGIEFDYCSVHSVWAFKRLGYETIIVNNNPETVSTDYDTADRLYFEPLTAEDVLQIIDVEQPVGVVVAFGGQTAIALTQTLDRHGIRILGTSAEGIDIAEDRERFDELLERFHISRPKGMGVQTLPEALHAAQTLGYPVLLRPSYVIGGQNMKIVHDDAEVTTYMQRILAQGIDNPVLVDKYMMGTELEVDVISDGTDVLIPGIMEHIERAGVHSGDSIAVYPPYNLNDMMTDKIVDSSRKLALALGTKGLVNIQYLIWENELYVIEVNPRASRTVPYISKVTGVPMVDVASRVMLGAPLAGLGYGTGLHPIPPYYAVKVPVFSFEKLGDVNAYLGPEMKSTGEVLGLGKTMQEALFKGLTSAGMVVGQHPDGRHGVFVSVDTHDLGEIVSLAKKLDDLHFALYATGETAAAIARLGIDVVTVDGIRESDHAFALLESGCIDYIVYTGALKDATMDDYIALHRRALQLGIPCFTSLDTANALADIIASRYNERNTELVDINHMRTERQSLKFAKMQATGDDYIYVENFDGHITCPESLCIPLCSRHRGIGGYGIVLIEHSDVADAKMRVFNRDGSAGGMGGNAIRCVAKYLYDNGIVPRDDLTIEAGGTVHRLHLYTRFGTVGLVTVDMGKPAFEPANVPVTLEGERVIDRPVTIAGGEYRITCLSMGNPHCVVFADRVDEVDVAHLGPQFEHADIFPARTNTEFIRVVNRTTIKMRVWERGNGETRACGTGACAAVVAATENGLCPKGEPITVKVSGGDLIVTYDDDGVRLTGNAELAFTGVTTY